MTARSTSENGHISSITRKYTHGGASLCDSHLIVRNYHQMDGGSTILDFTNLVCPGLLQRQLDPGYRSNPRRALRYDISRFYQNRVQRPLTRQEAKTVEHLCFALRDKTILLSTSSREGLFRLFRDSNQEFMYDVRTSSERSGGSDPDARRRFGPRGLLLVRAAKSDH